MLSFQRLDTYRCASEFFAIAVQLCATIPRGQAELRDRLRRAALSVPLNIAEGPAGHPTPMQHDILLPRAVLRWSVRRYLMSFVRWGCFKNSLIIEQPSSLLASSPC